MKLKLVRHAQVLVPAGLCYGASDLPVDPDATARAAQSLAATLPPSTQAVCSPLQRCAALASALQDRRPDLQLRFDGRLREMDFGAWEGRRWADIPRAELDAWAADFRHYRVGGGECVEVLMNRVAEALADAHAEAVPLLWITHAGVIRAVLCWQQGGGVPAHAAAWPRQELPHGGCTEVDCDPAAAHQGRAS